MLETRIIDELKLEPVDCCDLCGSKKLVPWARARGNQLVKCADCGLVCTSPRVVDLASKDTAIYDKAYFKQPSRMTQDHLDARRRSYAGERAALEAFLSPDETYDVLDVGCGEGQFLDSLPGHWNKSGCDISAYGLEEARARGIQTFHGALEDLDFDGRDFDIVYFRASLHHTLSPRAALRRARSLLKPGGRLVIAMSNCRDGLCGRLFKGHVKSYEQGHTYLFDEASLRRYMSAEGFSVEKVDRPYWGTGYDRWWHGPLVFLRFVQFHMHRVFGRLERFDMQDFASPPFHGNYVSVYGRKMTDAA